jgi:protein-disulfide isomerase
MGAAQSIGVTGTPMFVVNGQMVAGADIERIKKLLN